MAFSDVALLAGDGDFNQRVTACAAIEDFTSNPSQWSFDMRWQVAAMPGFGDKYASAIESGIVRPGNDPSVISDADILSGVQSLQAADAT